MGTAAAGKPRALHCNTHSTALHMWAWPWYGVRDDAHKAFGAGAGLLSRRGQTGWVDWRQAPRRQGKAGCMQLLQCPRFSKASCLPGMQLQSQQQPTARSWVVDNPVSWWMPAALCDRCLAEARKTIPSNFAGAALRL
jgi:hypothetical protein